MRSSTKLGIGLTITLAAFAQIVLRPILFVTLGLGRELLPISDFPFQCRRIEDPRLAACEDMWFSETTRKLFLACSDPMARKEWTPNIGNLNASGRALEDAIIALDPDKPKGSSFAYRVPKTRGFDGVAGDGRLHLLGLTGKDAPGNKVQILAVNAKPSVDSHSRVKIGSEKLQLLDNEKVGANMTVEWFETDETANELKWIQTYYHDGIRTPNNVAFSYGDGFWFTNDHGTAKTGWRFQAAMYTGNGDVSYCSSPSNCSTEATGLRFPNGLIMGMDGNLYVPSAFSGGISIYKPSSPSGALEKIDHIDIPYPLDNLSQDRNGDIWAAAIPKLGDFIKLVEDPLNVKAAPSTIFRIRKRSDGLEITKILEDRDAEVLPAATTAVHDAKTGRIFLSGLASPFLTVCEPKKGRAV